MVYCFHRQPAVFLPLQLAASEWQQHAFNMQVWRISACKLQWMYSNLLVISMNQSFRIYFQSSPKDVAGLGMEMKCQKAICLCNLPPPSPTPYYCNYSGRNITRYSRIHQYIFFPSLIFFLEECSSTFMRVFEYGSPCWYISHFDIYKYIY